MSVWEQVSMPQTDAAFERGDAFRVYAFVCGVTCVRRTDHDPPPTATFQQIYQQRPTDCRYAIVGIWMPPLGAERYYVLDLFNVKKTNDNQLITPKPRLEHDDLDAIIMATVLLYNKP